MIDVIVVAVSLRDDIGDDGEAAGIKESRYGISLSDYLRNQKRCLVTLKQS